jgi:LysM repeat protein
MTRPSITRAALVLIALAGCGGSVPDDTRVHEADPVALSTGTLPAAPATASPTASPDTGTPPPVPVVAEAPPAETAPVEGVEITVRTGENLVGIASVAGVSVEAIVEANGLDARDPLHPGQALLIPLSGELAHAFAEARDFARADRLDRYVAGRGGLVGVEAHAVRTGETAWAIAKEQAGVPVWVLSAFNPDTALDSLGIGQRVKVPVFADSVAALEEGPDEAATPAAPETPDAPGPGE